MIMEAVVPPRFTPQRVPLTPNEPTTLPDMYERVVRDYPKPDTLNYKREGAWHPISAADMLRRAKEIALGLYSLGVRRGDRVAIVDSGKIIAMASPDKLIDDLVAGGFERPKQVKKANLEDVFITLTGHELRGE